MFEKMGEGLLSVVLYNKSVVNILSTFYFYVIFNAFSSNFYMKKFAFTRLRELPMKTPSVCLNNVVLKAKQNNVSQKK